MKLFSRFLFIALMAIASNLTAQEPEWPAEGDSYGWVTSIRLPDQGVSDRKDTYLVNFSYYRGFTLRETGVVKVATDAFLYDMPQGTADDRLMNDVLVALMKQGLRVDVTRRGEWIQIGPWARLIPPGLIYDSRSLPVRPKS